MYQNQGTSYYDLLEVKPDADPAQILVAYQRAKEIYSPNSPALYSMFTVEEARELLKLVDEAFSTLSNRSRKKAYDLKMGFISESEASEPSVHKLQNDGKKVALSYETKAIPRADDGWDGSVRIHKVLDATPEGFSRTRFGSYNLDLAFENDIEAVEECDGSFLEKVRSYKNVSVEQLSDAMKISKSTLRALEQNDLGKLPVEVFTRGIVIQFSKMLGLDEQKVAKAYMVYYRAHAKPQS